MQDHPGGAKQLLGYGSPGLHATGENIGPTHKECPMVVWAILLVILCFEGK